MDKRKHVENVGAKTNPKLPLSVYRDIFKSVPGLYLILTPDFTIVGASDAYLKATNTIREKILGKPLFEVFPDNPNDPHATGVANLTASLHNVLRKKKPDTMAVQKYDIPLPKSNNHKEFEVRYWSPLNSPVFDSHKKVALIIHSVIDVTEFIELEQTKQEQLEITEQLREQNKLFQAQMEQTAKELEAHEKNERELREIDTLKADFVEIASHQLRTPLTSIKWSTEELLANRSNLSKQQQDHYVEQIHSSNERMIALIRELLDISKVDQENFTTSAELVWLPPILNQVLEDSAIQIEQKLIVVNQDIDPNLPMMFFDPVQIRLVFQNILINAIKYSSPGQTVNVGVKRQGQDVVISVADNGCGIPKEQQAKVFSKFFRADNARELSSDGTGVGLYIAKAIVDDAGGKLWFESAENKGSTFYIKIPIRYKQFAKKEDNGQG
jgi:signal transduction histidine kinase